jgi:hypothetical protein
MRMLTRIAAVWIIIVGGLMIIFYDGHIVIECIKCGSLLTRLFGVISIGLGLGLLFAGRRAG